MVALLADDHITSRFYTSNDAVVNGDLNDKKLLSLNWKIIPDMTENGLPLNLATNIRSCFAWHKMSTGMAIGQDMRTEVNYLAEKNSYLVNGIFYAGAVVVDQRGTILIYADETVNP
jgi:hypothetical protein